MDPAVIIETATPYWAGEAEIVETYLREHRSRERDVAWLRLQAYKEARLFREAPRVVQDAWRATGRVDHHCGGTAAAVRLQVEMDHFEALAVLLETLGVDKPDPGDELNFPTDRVLQRTRAAYRESADELARAAAEFTEGGGGAMYLVLGRLGETALDRQIAQTFERIYVDELDHGPRGITALTDALGSDADIARVCDIVRNVCRLRLAMRNEMFAWPLDEVRIAAIARGEIEPLAFPLPV